MTHLSDDQLTRWSVHGPGDDRDALVAHLAECGACATRYAAAVRAARMAATTPSNEDPRQFTEAAYALARPRRALTATWVGLAAAAVVAIAVFLPRIDRSRQQPPAVVFRGAGVTTLSPNGDVDGVSEFMWSSGINAPRFVVEVGDDRGVIVTAATTEPRLAAPAAVRNLARGVEYWWTVSAMDADGQRISTSERRTFRVRSSPQ